MVGGGGGRFVVGGGGGRFVVGDGGGSFVVGGGGGRLVVEGEGCLIVVGLLVVGSAGFFVVRGGFVVEGCLTCFTPKSSASMNINTLSCIVGRPVSKVETYC